jgi:hypothetical protein
VSEVEESQDPIEAAVSGFRDDDALESLRRSDLGPFAFNNAVAHLRVIRELAVALRLEDVAYLPARFEDEVLAQLNTLNSYLDQIRSFDAEQQQAPAQARDQIEQQVASVRDWMVRNVKPQLRKGVLEWAELSTQATEATRQATEANAEIQRILSDLRTRAGEAAAQQLSDYYRHQARSYADEARRTFRLTLGSLVAVAVVAALAFWIFPIEVDGSDSADRWEDLVRGLVV